MNGVKDHSKTRLVASLAALAVTAVAVWILSVHGSHVENSAIESLAPDSSITVGAENTIRTRSEDPIADQASPEATLISQSPR